MWRKTFKFLNTILHGIDSRTGKMITFFMGLALLPLYIGAHVNAHLGKFGARLSLIHMRFSLFLLSFVTKDGKLTNDTISMIVQGGIPRGLDKDSMQFMLEKAPDRIFPALAYYFSLVLSPKESHPFHLFVWENKGKLESAVLDREKEGSMSKAIMGDLLRAVMLRYTVEATSSARDDSERHQHQKVIDEIDMMLSYLEEKNDLYYLHAVHTFDYLIYRDGKCELTDGTKDAFVLEYFDTYYPEMYDLPLSWKAKLGNTTLADEIAARYAAGSSFLQKLKALSDSDEASEALGFITERQLALV